MVQTATDWWYVLQIVYNLFVEELNLGHWVLVFNVADWKMNLVVWAEVVAVFMRWHFIFDVLSYGNWGLVSPATWYISKGVSTTSWQNGRNIPWLNVSHTLSVTFDWEIEHPQTVTRKWVCTTLQEHGFRLESSFDLIHNCPKGKDIGWIVNSLIQWIVDWVVLASLNSDVIDTSCSWEEWTIFMKRYCHDSVCQQKCFLDSITVVAIDIDVEHSCVLFQQLQDSKHTVIDIAKSTGFTLFSMMETTRPINGNVRMLSHQTRSSK